ncbi:hypothetical protein ACPOLB_27075 [Rubrivivax sp. RP6-9]|uniref:hypothetical protein n=1 Tax=Rubrivivax sp. RP6-9 TaxID=3415750 RepID=UPI003CC6D3F1
MPTFRVELDRLCAKRAKDLGRDLTAEELREIDGRLFQAWIDAGRLDDLIRTIIANFGRDGGLEEIIVLGHHLRETKDVARIHALFRRLISIRVKAFHLWWPRAAEGHVGCMREAARTSAAAMDAYLEYFNSLDRLGLQEERENLRAEMQRFQAREAVRNVLPQEAAKRGGA